MLHPHGATQPGLSTGAMEWNVNAFLPLVSSPAHNANSDPCPLVDSEGHIFAVLTGQPDTASYKASVALAFQEIMKEGAATKFPASMHKHQHSLFAAINVSLTYSKGQTMLT